MPNDNNDRVFDVSKPHKVAPSPTSRPIIVGHQTMMGDPMVKDGTPPQPMPAGHKTIPVNVIHENDAPAQPPPPVPPLVPDHPESVVANAPDKPAAPPIPSNGEAAPPPAPPSGDLHLASLDDLIGHEHKPAHHMPDSQPQQPGEVQSPVLGPTHGHPRKKGKAKWLLLGLILLLVAAYLAIDSRAVKTSINLPFHIFKQPSAIAPVSGSTLANQSQVAGISGSEIATTGKLPNGWTWYTNTDPAFKFAYPTAWKLTTDTITNVTTVRLSQHETYTSFVKDKKYPNDPELDFIIYTIDPAPSTPSNGLDNTISGPDMKKLSVITVNKLPSALVESQFTSYDDSVQLSGCANLVCSFPIGGKFLIVELKTLGSHEGLDGHNLDQSNSIYKTQLEILKTFSF